MCLVRRFFLLVLLIAASATTGRAATSHYDGIAWVAPFPRISEIDPAWTAVGSCILAAALILRHSAKFRK